MSAKLKNFAGTNTFQIPAAALTGDNPDFGYYWNNRPADIVHEKNGKIVSVRSWDEVPRWRIMLQRLTTAQLSQLKTLWLERVMYLQPFGSDAYQIEVAWINGFRYTAESPTRFSIEIELEGVV